MLYNTRSSIRRDQRGRYVAGHGGYVAYRGYVWPWKSAGCNTGTVWPGIQNEASELVRSHATVIALEEAERVGERERGGESRQDKQCGNQSSGRVSSP